MTVIRVALMSSPDEGEHVDVDAYEYLVHLRLREGENEMGMSLGPDDARGLAAVLVHQASEVER